MREVQTGSEGYQPRSRTHADRSFSPTPSTLSLETMLAAGSHDRKNHPEDDHIAIAIDVHTVFLHADIDQDWYVEPPGESELNEDEVWKSTKHCSGTEKHQDCGINMW